VSTKEVSRRSPLHDEWAVKVKTRAGWKCEWCGLTADQIRELGGQLEAAHIAPWQEYPEKRFDPANGKALCTFRNRRHPEGLGNGYGCHNAMSGHWGHSYGTVPIHKHPGGFWHKVGVLAMSVPLWWAVVIADVDLRYYWAWSRHFTFGQATTIGGMFVLLLGLVAIWGACLILCHVALRRRWLGRGGRYLLHALVRLARKARRPLRASKLG
jgi:hypothetical protein